jgi:hypothetical protein
VLIRAGQRRVNVAFQDSQNYNFCGDFLRLALRIVWFAAIFGCYTSVNAVPGICQAKNL